MAPKMRWIIVALALVLPASVHVQYAKDGDFVVGVILEGISDCPSLKYESVAIVEAINFAISQIEADPEFAQVSKTSKIGYQIRDSCGFVDKEKDIAYALNMEKMKSKGDSALAKKSVDLVISEFAIRSLSAAKVLSIENTAQLSYSPNNIRLKQDASVSDADISLLISAFPDEINKVAAVVDIIKALYVEHVYLVGSYDAHGRSGLTMLKRLIDGQGVCSSAEMYVRDQQTATTAIHNMLKNDNIRVVVLHGHIEMDIMIFESAMQNNLTDLVFISTSNWKEHHQLLQPYARVVEGMISINLRIEPSRNYETYVGGLRRPYSDKPWLERMFVSLGGDTKKCYEPILARNATTKYCFDAEEDLKVKLINYKETAVFVIDAIYAIAHSLKNKGNSTFLSSFIKLRFNSPLTNNVVDYASSMSAKAQTFELLNIQGNTSVSQTTKWVGEWSKNEAGRIKLNKQHLRWKAGSLDVPTSRCNDECPMGTRAEYLNKCCWTCEPCPNGTVSNVTNSKTCFLCEKGFAANPNQSMCALYKTTYFHWFNTLGQFMIFLIVLGVCVVLFCLGILSQNSEHQLVKASSYKLMFIYLIGITLLFLSPIPLLVEPTVQTCSTFIGLFNIGLTIPLAVLMSKTAIVADNYYDEEGDLIKTGMGKSPRAVVFFITLAVQLIVVLAGLFVLPPSVNHNVTDRWDYRYAECANHESIIFWVALSLNMIFAFLCNALSCGAKDMDRNFGELKDIIKTTLLLFLLCLAHISVIYATQNQALAQGQAVLCILYGFFMVLGFAAPKVFTILFKTKSDGKTVDNQSLIKSEEPRKTTATHASDGFKHHGVIQMRMNEESDEETRA